MYTFMPSVKQSRSQWAREVRAPHQVFWLGRPQRRDALDETFPMANHASVDQSAQWEWSKARIVESLAADRFIHGAAIAARLWFPLLLL